jgi:MFS family permease
MTSDSDDRARGEGGLLPSGAGGAFFGDGRLAVLAFCWLGWVFDFYDLILFAFVKRGIAADLGLRLEVEIAWIDGLTLLATAVGGLAFGRYADRVGRRRALVASILVYSLGALMTGLASGFGSLLTARIVTGLGVGGEWGIGHALVAEAFAPRHRGRAAGILQAGSPVAMALAAAVGCFAVPALDEWVRAGRETAGGESAGWHGWQLAFLISAAPALLVVFARAAIPDRLAGAGSRDVVVGRTPGASHRPRVGSGDEAGDVAALFRPPLRRASLALLAVLVLHMAGFWSVYAWLPAGLQKDAGVSLAFVGWFQIGINSVHVVADVAFGFLADRFGRVRMFVLFCLLFAAGLATIALGYERLTSDMWTFGFAMAAVGLGAGTWSCLGVLFAEHYPGGLRATAASTFYNASRAVQLPMQPLLGQLFLAFGTFVPALWVGAGTAVLSAFAILALPAPAWRGGRGA